MVRNWSATWQRCQISQLRVRVFSGPARAVFWTPLPLHPLKAFSKAPRNGSDMQETEGVTKTDATVETYWSCLEKGLKEKAMNMAMGFLACLMPRSFRHPPTTYSCMADRAAATSLSLAQRGCHVGFSNLRQLIVEICGALRMSQASTSSISSYFESWAVNGFYWYLETWRAHLVPGWKRLQSARRGAAGHEKTLQTALSVALQLSLWLLWLERAPLCGKLLLEYYRATGITRRSSFFKLPPGPSGNSWMNDE